MRAELVLLFTVSFVSHYTADTAFILLPPIAIEWFQWSTVASRMLMGACGLFFPIVGLIMAQIVGTPRSLYNSVIVSLSAGIVSCILLVLMKFTAHSDTSRIPFIGLFIIANVVCWMFEESLGRQMIAGFLPDDMQSFGLGVRLFCSNPGATLAGLLLSVVNENVLIWSAGIGFVTAVYILLFYHHKSKFY